MNGPGLVAWELPSRKDMGRFDGAGMARSVAVSPDGRLLATTHEDRTVKVWEAAGRTLVRTLGGNGGVGLGVAFAPDGRTLATATGDGTVTRWAVPGR